MRGSHRGRAAGGRRSGARRGGLARAISPEEVLEEEGTLMRRNGISFTVKHWEGPLP
ncbi:hypothetical protein LEMLEM_LOCUS24939 [Lemmus lemmus]